MTIGIIVAMSSEQELVSHLLTNKLVKIEANQTFTEGTIGNHHIILLQSGIGKVCAAVGAVELIRQYQPDYIINSGVAGSLDQKVGVMDVVIGARTVYHDVDCFTDNPHGQIQGLPLYFEADPKLLKNDTTKINEHNQTVPPNHDSALPPKVRHEALPK